MAELPPIDMAIASPAPRFPGDVEPLRMSRIALQHLTHHDGSRNYPYSWGYAIFRTVYAPGADEVFAKAVERLAVYAKFFTQDEHTRPRLGQGAFDPHPNEELRSRYYCEVVQDEDILAGASESEVGGIFDVWIRQHRRAATTTSASPRPNARLLSYLMLDEEASRTISSSQRIPVLQSTMVALGTRSSPTERGQPRREAEVDGGCG